jgi:hypothetical protein
MAGSTTSTTSSTTTSTAGRLPARLAELAPGLTAAFVRESLHRAIHGIGPLPAAAVSADRQLIARRGDVDQTIRDVIERHVRYAAAQGFLTNLGGLTTMAFTVPTNISGLALVECRMIASIAHLRHYDLHDPRVRNAVLVCLLGEESVTSLVADLRLPAPPMALATAPAHDPTLDRVISAEVAADLISKVAGKKVAGQVGRRIPLVGGLVGLGADGYATWKIGRYADRELLPLAAR